MKIQISFSKDADLHLVEGQINKMFEMLEYIGDTENDEFICGFLTRKQVNDRGWSTEICDLLDRKFGDKLKYYTAEYETADDAIKNVSRIRSILKRDADVLVVLGERIAKGVIEEIKLASTNNAGNARIIIFAEDEVVY